MGKSMNAVLQLNCVFGMQGDASHHRRDLKIDIEGPFAGG
jgi:hypothetical protein